MLKRPQWGLPTSPIHPYFAGSAKLVLVLKIQSKSKDFEDLRGKSIMIKMGQDPMKYI